MTYFCRRFLGWVHGFDNSKNRLLISHFSQGANGGATNFLVGFTVYICRFCKLELYGGKRLWSGGADKGSHGFSSDIHVGLLCGITHIKKYLHDTGWIFWVVNFCEGMYRR